MTEKINNICKLEYAPLSRISQFIEASSGHLLIEATWTQIPLIPGASLSIGKDHTRSGRKYDCDFTGRLRTILDLHSVGIFRITLDDGSMPLIIGDPDLPVRTREAISLQQKSISFAHEAWHYPWKYAGEPASGSSGSGGEGI